MRWEFPECKRCFFCLPLRYGIIIFGYLNLLFAVLMLTIDSIWIVKRGNGTIDVTEEITSLYKGVGFYVQAWVPLVLYTVEVIFNVMLLFGAHTKRIKYIRIYYYYGITTLFATFATFLVVMLQEFSFSSHGSLPNMAVTFLGLATHIYLLLLIRTEMSKRRYNEDTTSYVNQMTHASYPTNWRDTDLL